jgi:hypothetical protein
MTTLRSRTRHARAIASVATAALLATVLLPAPVLAAPPANDDIASATVVAGVPYADGPYDTTEATSAATDPGFCFDPEGSPDSATVWYSFTPTADDRYAASTFGSDYDTTLYVGTSNGAGGIDVITCTDDSGGTLQSAVGWDASAGTEYLIAVGTCCGGGASGQPGGGSLVFNLGIAPPAPVLDLAIDPVGHFSAYGDVTLTGTLTCENANGAIVDASVERVAGRFRFRGFAFAELPCDGTQRITLQATSEDGRFTGGRASVFAFTEACNDFECVQDFVELQVRLRR